MSPPVTETRGGWFETGIGEPDDFRYMVARILSGHPRNAQGLIPLTGTWRPRIRTLTTTIGDTATPLVRSFVSVDAAWHVYDRPGHPNGFPGDVLVDQAGAMDREVAIDTTRYTDGVHRLYIRADGQTPSGKTGGVYTLDFLVCNGGPPCQAPVPTPTPTPTPTATPTPDPPYDPECRPDCDQTIADLRTENATLTAQRDRAQADLEAMTASRNAWQARAEAAEADLAAANDKLARIGAIVQE